MNDDFRDLKQRIKRLDAVLMDGGLSDATFAQALSKVRRAERRGDRTREPTPELKTLLAQAESLAQKIG